MKNIVGLSFLFFLFQAPSNGQYIINYSIKDGLSSYNTREIVQDKYGFIWVGTQDGLNRFDGKEFDVYNKLSIFPHRILNNHIKALAITGDSLWVSSALGGVSIINTKLNEVCDSIYPQSIKGMSAWIEKILPDANGTDVWMSGFEGLFKYNVKTRTVKSWRKNPLLPDQALICRKFLFLSKEKILVNVEGCGFAIFNTITEKFEELYSYGKLGIRDAGHFMVSNMLFINGRICFGSTNGIYLMEIQPVLRIVACDGFKEVQHKEINHLLESDQKIYVSCSNGVFIYSNAGAFIDKINKTNSLLSDEKISGSFIDKDNNLWLTSYSGLHLFNKKDLSYSQTNDYHNLNIKDVSTICRVGNDSLILCTWNGLFLYDKKAMSVKHIAYHDRFSNGPFFNIWPLGQNEFIASSQSSNYLLVKRAGSYILLDSIEKPRKWPVTQKFIFSSFLQIKKNQWLFGSEFEDGMILYNGRGSKIINSESKELRISENSINSFFMTGDSSIYILYDNSMDVLNYATMQVRNIKLGKLPSAPDENVFFSMAEASGKLWIGTYGGGLLYYDIQTKKWGKITTEEGLCNNSIYTIVKENDESIWVSTNIGLSKINTKTHSISNFFSKNSYLLFAFDERSALKTDSSIFFGGPNGLIEIFPDEITDDKEMPSLFIKKISFLQNTSKATFSDLNVESINVPYRAPYLEFDLACNYFNSPELNTFQYRVNEKSSWINIGTNNKIRLPNFEPGKYTFYLRSCNKYGTYSEVKTLAIIILPPWYQTWWFQLLVILAAAGIILAFYLYRISQIKKQHEIRKNIATDLHDDLGSTLNSVKVFTNLAIHGVKQEESLQQVKSNLNEASTGLRDMIWVLDDALDTVEELVVRLNRFVLPLAGANNIDISIKATSEANPHRLSKEQKRNFYMICKEAINNSIKYSQASRIEINITYSAKKLRFDIVDNGIGFNTAEKSEGYGMKNMKYRAAQIKYNISIDSQPGKGTAITLNPA